MAEESSRKAAQRLAAGGVLPVAFTLTHAVPATGSGHIRHRNNRSVYDKQCLAAIYPGVPYS